MKRHQEGKNPAWFRLSGWILGLVLLWPLVVSAGASLEDYKKRVGEAATITERLVRDARQTGKPQIWLPTLHVKPEDASALRNLLPQAETVDYQGQIMAVGNHRVYTLLSEQEKSTSWGESLQSLETLNDEIQTLRHYLNETGKPLSMQGTEGRGRIEEILKRDAFTLKKDDSWREKLWKELIDWLGKNLGKYWPKLGVGTSGYAEGLKLVLWVVFGIALVWFARLLFLRFKNRAKIEQKTGPKTILGEDVEEIKSADELLSDGLECARKGEFRQAIRKVYIALLFEMDQREVIRIEPGLTNREYLNAVRRQTRLYPPMSDMTNRFDEVWYGQMTSSQDDYQQFLVKYREALGALPGSAK
ncbi:MAG: DUF4129 domain-containing protein [Blastocatellia bacterium]|nr:DUF4129 domain-containing protein [Blastocatellia bacterium]